MDVVDRDDRLLTEPFCGDYSVAITDENTPVFASEDWIFIPSCTASRRWNPFCARSGSGAGRYPSSVRNVQFLLMRKWPISLAG